MISRCKRTGNLEVSNTPVPKGAKKKYLLTEADSRPRIKREEDEWVRNEVLLHPLIQEPVGVEF